MALFSRKISTREMVPLCRQIATSYDAGIPILKTLQMAERNTGSRTAQQVLLEVRTSVEAGNTLGEAARAQQDRLPPFFVELLASGERGGRLDVMLRDLADYYEDRLALNRAVAGALAYPLFLVTATWFIGSFALGIISQISFDARARFSLGDYFQSWLQFQGVTLLIVAAALAVLWFLGRTGAPQQVAGRIGAHLWPFSSITRKFALARFFRSFGLLIGSGMNLKYALNHAAESTGNPYIRDDLLRALPHIAQGRTLQEAFSVCRTLSPVSREMLAVGEETGNMEIQLRKVSEWHFAEAQMATKVALRFLNILLILVVGGVVGATIISFYTKLFSLYDSI